MKRKSRFMALIMSLAMIMSMIVMPTGVSATEETTTTASGTCGNNLIWVLTSDGTLTISGTGEMYDYTSSTMPWYDFKSDIKKLIVDEGVTSIGDFAFYDCSGLTDITISDSLTTLGFYSFACCTGLTEVKLPKGLKETEAWVFSGCSELKDIDISETSLTRISYGMFYGTNIEEFIVPDGITEIIDQAFDGTPIREISIPTSVKTIWMYVFQGATLITDVYYAGTIKQWQEVTVYENGNDYFLSATIHCTDGDIIEGVIPTETPEPTPTPVPSDIDENGFLFSFQFDTAEEAEQLVDPDKLENYKPYLVSSINERTDSIAVIKQANATSGVGEWGKVWCDEKGEAIQSVTVEMLVYNPNRNTIGIYPTNDSQDGIPSANNRLGVRLTGDGKICYMHNSWTEVDTGVTYNTWQWNKIGYTINCVDKTMKIYLNDQLVYTYNVENMDTTGYAKDIRLLLSTSEQCYFDCFVGYPGEYNSPTEGDFPMPENSIIDSGLCGENVTWSLMRDGTLTISGTGKMEEYFGGSYWRWPWSYRKGVIEKVIIEDGVTEIRSATFYECDNLKAVTIEGDMDSIGNGAFYWCENLESVVVNGNITNIKDVAFAFCEKLSTITVSGTIKNIGDMCFSGCKSLTSFSLPEGLETIGFFAFADCSNFLSIDIPSTVKSIGSGAFSTGSYNIATINVSEANKYFISENGVLFDIDKTRLIQYPTISIQLPDGIVRSQYIIPDGVTDIDIGAFHNCYGLESLSIPQSVMRIGISAFYGAQHLTDVPEENSVRVSGKITYLDGSPVVNGKVELKQYSVERATTTNEYGEYDLGFVTSGSYSIFAVDSNDNFGSEAIKIIEPQATVDDTDDTMEFTLDSPISLIGETNIKLKAGWVIAGTVSEENTTVKLSDAEGNVINKVTTEDGTFRFDNISNGTYIIGASTDTGRVVKEVTVFNDNITDIVIEIAPECATIEGWVYFDEETVCDDATVSIYNSEGVLVSSTTTDDAGKYIFTGFEVGEYSIVVEAYSLVGVGYIAARNHYTGFGHITITENKTYTVDNITVYEDDIDGKATISGKVTANGEANIADVVLVDIFKHEVAQMTTKSNGKYTFKNVRDGLYIITATTESDGMGMTVVVVVDGEVYGNTDIAVYKSDKVHKHEQEMDDIPECGGRDDAMKYKDDIIKHKKFYDGLSDKEKKQLSKKYINRLNKLVEWISQVDYKTPDDVVISNGGTVVDAEEIKNEDIVEIEIKIEKVEKDKINGGNNGKAHEHSQIDKAAKDKHVAEYYDISMTKNGIEISNIKKDTDTTGKVRVTMPIPEEYRGHKHYSFIHMHNGEARTLTDLDDDPDTITFEVDRFSTFALAYTDTELVEETQAEEYTVKFSIYETGFESEPVEELDSITGTTITMPSCSYEREGYMFAGWVMSDGTKIFLPAGAEYVPQADTEFVPVWISLNMNAGATVRLAEPTGLRFTSTVDTDGYNIIKAIDANAYCGTIITPMELVLGEEFTKMWMNTNGTPYLDIVNKGFAEENETTMTWRSVIANMNEANYNREFAGRAYIEFTYTNGKTVTLYSDFNETDNARAIAQVAKEELENNADRYTAEQLEILNTFAQYAE